MIYIFLEYGKLYASINEKYDSTNTNNENNQIVQQLVLLFVAYTVCIIRFHYIDTHLLD